MSASDLNLVRGLSTGSSRAVEEFVTAHLPQMLRIATAALSDAVAAEEVVQSTFVTFVEKLSDFESRSSLRTWLIGILYNKVRESRRRAGTEVPFDAVESCIEARFDGKGSWLRPPAGGDQLLYGDEVGVLIESCLRMVPSDQRMAFILREVEGLSTSEMCKILGVTSTNLGVLLYRGRNRLRECLESRGIRGSLDAHL